MSDHHLLKYNFYDVSVISIAMLKHDKSDLTCRLVAFRNYSSKSLSNFWG